MKKISVLAILTLLANPALASSAQPGDDGASGNPEIHFPHGLQLGVGVSATGGLDGFIGYNNKKFDSFWLKRLGIRFDFATTQPIKSTVNSALDRVIGDDGVEIGDGVTIKDVELKAKHMAAMLDFYPFGDTWFLGGWRVSGGYYWGDMQADAKLTGQIDGLPDEKMAFELAGNQYRYNGNQLNGAAHADWKYNGPYVGTGFDFGIGFGLKIYLDAGVVFTNRAAQLGLDVPLENLEYYNGATWVAVNTPELESALADAQARALNDAQDELDKYKYYPIVKLGFMYRF